MDLEKEYEKLYQHWLKEFEHPTLTNLNQKQFEQYTAVLKSIENHHEDESEPVKFKLFESYKNNITFLYEDLLKMRELKIINTSLFLKDLDLEDILEAEKLLYQNLVSSIKGYRKVKAISLFEGQEFIESEEQIPMEAETVSKSTESEIIKEEKSEFSEIVVKQEIKEDVDFMILRFLKKTPPLVGIDLINYGPFEEEDLASLPTQNAKILILEKFAEKVDLS
jgi:DNA replication initiation complex subunit (GINS family)